MFRNRWLRRVCKGLPILIAVTAAACFLERFLTRREGEKRHADMAARLDATDPRWRYDELDADRGSLPDAQNSALLVPQFKATLASPSFEKDPRLGSDHFVNVPPNHVLHDETYAAIDEALGNNARALSIATSFGNYPKGLRRYALPPVHFELQLPDVQNTRSVYQLLDLAAERRARDGRGGAALEYVLPMLNAGHSLESEPFYISALVRMACLRAVVVRVERTLALANPKERLLAVQNMLMAEAGTDLFWYSARGERAVMDHMFSNLRSGTISIKDISGSGGGSSPAGGSEFSSGLANWWYEPHFAADHALSLEILTEVYNARTLPEHQQRAELKRIELVIKSLPPAEAGSLLTRALTPAFTKLHDASLRVRASLRCAAAGVAVERFRLLNGHWPENLDEIPKDILSAIPPDPFDGKPLKYVRRGDGVTVYSIGLDEVDDGGTIPVGKTTNEPGQDIGFRLYDPELRGLPAVPRKPAGLLRFGARDDMPLDVGPVFEFGPEPREIGQ